MSKEKLGSWTLVQSTVAHCPDCLKLNTFVAKTKQTNKRSHALSNRKRNKPNNLRIKQNNTSTLSFDLLDNKLPFHTISPLYFPIWKHIRIHTFSDNAERARAWRVVPTHLLQAISKLLITSVSKRVLVQNGSICREVKHFFHLNSLQRRLVLTQMQKAKRKWPTSVKSYFLENRQSSSYSFVIVDSI